MHILLSNDDGYSAQGLIALAEALKAYADVTVVAPERNRSGASNSLTLDRPLHAVKTSNGYIKVDGTRPIASIWPSPAYWNANRTWSSRGSITAPIWVTM